MIVIAITRLEKPTTRLGREGRCARDRNRNYTRTADTLCLLRGSHSAVANRTSIKMIMVIWFRFLRLLILTSLTSGFDTGTSGFEHHT